MDTPTKITVTIPVTTERTVRTVMQGDFVPVSVDWERQVHQGGQVGQRSVTTTCWVYGSQHQALLIYADRESVPGFLPQPPHWFWAALSDMTGQPAEQVTS